jgi:glycosyltransferase involved in cell wall biosynthesis
MPLVSIITPFFNEGAYLPEAFQSLKAQTFADFEAIFVDDASTDGGAACIEGCSDKRFRLIRNSSNAGNLRSRNIGIEASDGKYLAVLDGDDIALPSRLEKQVAFLEAHPDVDICGAFIHDFFPDGKEVPSTRETQPELIAADSLFEIPVIHTTCMMRRTVLDSRDKLYDETAKSGLDCKDYKMFVDLIVEGRRVANIPEVLVLKRVHHNSITFKSLTRSFAGNAEARSRLFAILGLTDQEVAAHNKLCDWMEWPSECFRFDADARQVSEAFTKIIALNDHARLFAPSALKAILHKKLSAFNARKNG